MKCPVVSPDGECSILTEKHPLNTGPDLHDDIWYARLMADSSGCPAEHRAAFE